MSHFAHFHFADPAWLWLAAGAPLVLAWLHGYAARARREQLARVASPHFLDELTASHSPGRRRLKNILLLVAVALAGLALARPQWGTVEETHAWLGEDIVFALDCSASMTTTDVVPSRLQHAKYSILNFVQRSQHGRVGLVAFAGTAFIQCPLTFDTDAFDETLLAMDEKSLPVPGTDIGRALREANAAMDKGSHRKMIILVTDGEDLEKSGVTVARQLATNGVVIFTIGVGTTGGKEITVNNAAGQAQFLRDARGEVVHSRLDENTLRQIAGATGGSYFPLGPLGEGLAHVRPAIQTLENSGGPSHTVKNGVDRFHLPIALLLVLLVMESLIGTRRARLAQPA